MEGNSIYRVYDVVDEAHSFSGSLGMSDERHDEVATVVSALTNTNRISLADLNVEGAEQNTSLTSKVFTKVTFEWTDSDYRPHLGVMGEFEISTSDNNALPQWGVSLVGGVSF